MKILIISSQNLFSTYGGGQIYVKNIIDELIRIGLSPTIATPGDRTFLSNSYKNCAIYTFDFAQAIKDYKTLVQFLLEVNPTIVHAHGYKAAFALACKELNIPCIITAHHGGILCPAGGLLNYRDEICQIKANYKDCLPCVLKNIRGGFKIWPLIKILPLSVRLYLGKLIQKLPFILYVTPILQTSQLIQNKAEEWKAIFTNASLLIAPSKAIADIMELNGAPKNKIKIIPHGIPLHDRTFLTEYNNTNKENKLLKFFFVGRICHVKGVHIMLEAFDQISTTAELHIIGGVGNKTEEKYMRNLKKKYKHNPLIIWHGKVEKNEIDQLIIEYDIMIHPAIFLEVFGLTISEGLALSKPVLATRCGGAEMQIINEINGWLVEPNKTQDIVNTINKIIDSHNGPGFDINSTQKKVTTIETHIKSLLSLYININNDDLLLHNH